LRLDWETRTAILRLTREGYGSRRIGRMLGISRTTVRDVVASGVAEVPAIERASRLDDHIDLLRELFVDCQGNHVRVHEKLAERGVAVSYPALTAFCRQHGIGRKPQEPVGSYPFAPGEEMQHDTSPHDVVISGRRRRLQCASLVLCYSRMLFAQVYPTFNRFWCRVFLTEALRFFGGAASRCMIDNTSVIIAHGRGRDAVPAPEMIAFAERFGFVFEAHEVGDANRSAHVERQFDHIEHNFYPGRTFASLVDCNGQMRTWCGQKNGSFKRHLQARPLELFAREAPVLTQLPPHVPEVYEPVERIVDVEGFVNVHTNRYSLPAELIGCRVTVHVTQDRLRIFHRQRLVCEHERSEDGARARIMLDEHKRQRRWNHVQQLPPLPEETVLRAVAPELAGLVDALKKRHGGRAVQPIRRLHHLYVEYQTQPLLNAVRRALDHGLTDLGRIETMVLRNIADGDVFRLSESQHDELGDHSGGERPPDRDEDRLPDSDCHSHGAPDVDPHPDPHPDPDADPDPGPDQETS
jgi:transposase